MQTAKEFKRQTYFRHSSHKRPVETPVVPVYQCSAISVTSRHSVLQTRMSQICRENFHWWDVNAERNRLKHSNFIRIYSVYVLWVRFHVKLHWIKGLRIAGYDWQIAVFWNKQNRNNDVPNLNLMSRKLHRSCLKNVITIDSRY